MTSTIDRVNQVKAVLRTQSGRSALFSSKLNAFLDDEEDTAVLIDYSELQQIFTCYTALLANYNRLRALGLWQKEPLGAVSTDPLFQLMEKIYARDEKLLTVKKFKFLSDYCAEISEMPSDALPMLLESEPGWNSSCALLEIFSILRAHNLCTKDNMEYFDSCDDSAREMFARILVFLNNLAESTLTAETLVQLRSCGNLTQALRNIKSQEYGSVHLAMQATSIAGHELIKHYPTKKQSYFFPKTLQRVLAVRVDNQSYAIYKAFVEMRQRWWFPVVKFFFWDEKLEAFAAEPLAMACAVLQKYGKFDESRFLLLTGMTEQNLKDFLALDATARLDDEKIEFFCQHAKELVAVPGARWESLLTHPERADVLYILSELPAKVLGDDDTMAAVFNAAKEELEVLPQYILDFSMMAHNASEELKNLLFCVVVRFPSAALLQDCKNLYQAGLLNTDLDLPEDAAKARELIQSKSAQCATWFGQLDMIGLSRAKFGKTYQYIEPGKETTALAMLQLLQTRRALDLPVVVENLKELLNYSGETYGLDEVLLELEKALHLNDDNLQLVLAKAQDGTLRLPVFLDALRLLNLNLVRVAQTHLVAMMGLPDGALSQVCSQLKQRQLLNEDNVRRVCALLELPNFAGGGEVMHYLSLPNKLHSFDAYEYLLTHASALGLDLNQDLPAIFAHPNPRFLAQTLSQLQKTGKNVSRDDVLQQFTRKVPTKIPSQYSLFGATDALWQLSGEAVQNLSELGEQVRKEFFPQGPNKKK